MLPRDQVMPREQVLARSSRDEVVLIVSLGICTRYRSGSRDIYTLQHVHDNTIKLTVNITSENTHYITKAKQHVFPTQKIRCSILAVKAAKILRRFVLFAYVVLILSRIITGCRSVESISHRMAAHGVATHRVQA